MRKIKITDLSATGDKSWANDNLNREIPLRNNAIAIAAGDRSRISLCFPSFRQSKQDGDGIAVSSRYYSSSMPVAFN